jgi:hypothetical protein
VELVYSVAECLRTRRGSLWTALSDPLDFYISDLLTGLLGRFHNKVKNPTLIIERYRGKFPNRVLEAAYYAAWRHEASGYSPTVPAKLEQLAGLQGAA